MLGAKARAALAFCCGRTGWKKCKIPQTAQYPSAMPKINAVAMVPINRNESMNALISSAAARPTRPPRGNSLRDTQAQALGKIACPSIVMQLYRTLTVCDIGN